jgi:hypothetical protein
MAKRVDFNSKIVCYKTDEKGPLVWKEPLAAPPVSRPICSRLIATPLRSTLPIRPCIKAPVSSKSWVYRSTLPSLPIPPPIRQNLPAV